MNSRTGIRIITIVIILAAVPACRTGEKAARTTTPARALWEGNWKSTMYEGSSGTVTALFPDPLPHNTEFPVEATISYTGSSRHVVKTVTTAMTGHYTDTAGGSGASSRIRRLLFSGMIVETDQIIRYTARPDGELTEFRGEYSSGKPDDRGTFFIRKTKSMP